MTCENVHMCSHVLVRKQIVLDYSPIYLCFFLPLQLQLKNKKENIHITEKERGSHQWIKDYNKYSERN